MGTLPRKGIPPQDLSSTTQGLNLLGTVQEVTVSQNEAAIMKTDHVVIIAPFYDDEGIYMLKMPAITL